ncbi:MAG: hypothetical protein DDT42_00843 [candidate division WS2 bacterium]|uniref:ABC transporter permease n=1 Tax=Psychracetigena formicireducens TaxID=2986056 RepID=A0A9E2BHH3_PSYF1|nr:hypothetical protein [Candidatus Psychracetigena formicireducens]
MKILALIGNTYKESVRQPVFFVLLIGGAILIYTSPFYTLFAFGGETKMIKDMAFATITVCSLLLALLSASTVVVDEIESKRLLTLISKPLTRSEFIFGKFIGIIFSVFMAMAILALIFVLTLWQIGELEPMIFRGMILIYTKVALLTAISVAISTRMPVIVNIVICILLFILGYLNNYFFGFFEGRTFFVHSLGRVFFTIIPNLENFNVAAAIAVGTPVSIRYLLSTILYGIVYIVIALLIAITLFQKREVA